MGKHIFYIGSVLLGLVGGLLFTFGILSLMGGVALTMPFAEKVIIGLILLLWVVVYLFFSVGLYHSKNTKTKDVVIIFSAFLVFFIGGMAISQML